MISDIFIPKDGGKNSGDVGRIKLLKWNWLSGDYAQQSEKGPSKPPVGAAAEVPGCSLLLSLQICLTPYSSGKSFQNKSLLSNVE